jgi:hypothetical protein
LVAIDLQDAWALASHSSNPMRVVVTPLLSSFAGGALGDRFGRVDPDTPQADPASPPWLRRRPDGAGEGVVYVALRRDLRSPPLKRRKPLGGTVTERLEGNRALKFYGALAEQHWRSAGANAVRLLTPTSGRAGFNNHGRG